MTNPTSNFGWQMPTSTDLVTDLPADFEVFGQAVDTDFVDLLGGTTGQVLSKTSATDLDFTWINNDTGDITGVTAGTGISGGGTSGTVTVTNDMATTITAAGDIVVGTGNGTYDNLPIGTTAQILTADTTVSPYKVKWAAPAAAASGLTLIKRSSFTTVTTTTTTFDNVFTSTYKAYKIVFETISPNSGAVNLLFQYRVAAATQSGANYYTVSAGTNQAGTLQTLSDSAGTSAKIVPIQSGGYISLGEMLVTLVGGGSQGPMYAGHFYAQTSQTAFTCGGSYNAAIVADGFILSASSSTITGTVSVYGLGA